MFDFSVSEEHKGLIETARRFTKERIIPVAAECDRDSRFPMDVFKDAWELGIINPTVPEAYGGAGFGELENALITEELAYGCTGIQTSMLANGLALTPIGELFPRLVAMAFDAHLAASPETLSRFSRVV